MNLAEDLGIEPWLAIPLNAETVLEDAPLTVFGISTTDLSTKDNVMVSQLIDSLLCITSAVSDGKGGTVYTIELMNRPVLALAKAFGGMIMMGGDNADLERDLELRRLDGMVRDAVTFLAHLHETSAGDLGASDLTLNVDTDETGAIAFKMTTTVIPQSFTLVQPLLTITIDEMMAAQSQDSTSWSFMMPVHEEMDWDASAGCSVIDMRRGVCEMPYVSRRHLGQ